MMMKKSYFALIAGMSVLLAASAFAGEQYTQTTTQASEIFGSGWYGAIDIGANIYQVAAETSETSPLGPVL